jgi:hypothetical protein
LIRTLDALAQPVKESYLLPPEGEDVENGEEIAKQVKELAQQAAERLSQKNKNGKVFLFY